MTDIDFLPERIKIQRVRRKRLARQMGLLAACAVALTACAYVREARISRAKAESAMLEDCAANVRRQLAVRQSLEQEQAALNIKKQVADQLGSRVNPHDIIAELSRLLPKTTSLTSLGLEAMEVPETSGAPGFETTDIKRTRMPDKGKSARTVKRVMLIIDGLAPNDIDVANFIGQLSACPLFEEVNMGFTRRLEFRGQEAREFQVRCYIAR